MRIRKIFIFVLLFVVAGFWGLKFYAGLDVPLTTITSGYVKDSVAGDYLSARFATTVNDADAAVKYFSSALNKDPKNKELLEKGYELMLVYGRVRESIDLARRFVEEDGESPDSKVLIALEQIKKKNFSKAEGILNDIKIGRLHDIGTASELVIPLLKIWVIAGEGDYARALGELQERKQDSLESFTKYQMALLYDMSGQTKEAKELFDGLSEDTAKSLRLTEVAANFYQRNGESEKAISIIDRYVEDSGVRIDSETILSNKLPVIQTPTQGVSELLLEIASFLYSNRLDRMALGYANMSLFLTPDFPHAKLLLAKLLKASERYDEAIATLETITYPPHFNWQARLNIAHIYHIKKEHQKAEQLLLEMAKQNQQDREALLTLGDVLMDAKEYARAIDVYTQAMARTREEVPHRDWVQYYARGIAYERSGKWPEAEKDFLEALEMKPNQPDVLNYLGYSWLVMDKNIEEAEKMLIEAVSMRPDDPHILDSYGWALYKIKDYKGAAKYLEKANLLLPDDVTTNDHLGDVYWKLGRTKEAYFQWKRALTFDPKDEERIQIEAKITNGLDVAPVAAANPEKKESAHSSAPKN